MPVNTSTTKEPSVLPARRADSQVRGVGLPNSSCAYDELAAEPSIEPKAAAQGVPANASETTGIGTRYPRTSPELHAKNPEMDAM